MEIVKDLDGHKYRLPKEYVNDFNQLLAKIEIVRKVEGRSERWYDLNADLDNSYGLYMIG